MSSLTAERKRGTRGREMSDGERMDESQQGREMLAEFLLSVVGELLQLCIILLNCTIV